MEKLFDVVFEDADLLVINKPAGLVCHPTKGDQYSSLISRTRLYASEQFTPYIVNRLDRETSGIVVVAKNAATAGELGKKWEARAVRKEYLAIVHGDVIEDHGVIHAPLGKDESSRVVVKDCVRPDGSPAQTEWFVERRVKNELGSFSLLRVVPLSGRKHQIRIHLQSIGHPIVGDKLYGGDEDCYLALVENRLTEEQRRKLILPQQALHAEKVQFTFRGAEKSFSAEPEEWFVSFAAGG
ncbi:MAG: RluA family pseudouridine synthase [Verrucomicrobia bacterium]|nr:RluA family pseudouridine synthase [Verrucomicrobiota bacterium]